MGNLLLKIQENSQKLENYRNKESLKKALILEFAKILRKSSIRNSSNFLIKIKSAYTLEFTGLPLPCSCVWIHSGHFSLAIACSLVWSSHPKCCSIN